MFLFKEFNEIVSEFESHSITFLERAENFRNTVRLRFDGLRKYVIMNSVSKQRLERVSEYVTRVQEMIIIRMLHDMRTNTELTDLDFNVKQLDVVTIDGRRSEIEEVSVRRWEVIVEQQRLVGSHLQDPPIDDTSSSSSSLGDEDDLGFADEVDKESTLLDGASSTVLDDIAVINQELQQLNGLLNQHAPPQEEVAQESSSSLLDGDSRSALDNLALIHRELQKLNDMLHLQALPQEVAQESSNIESGDGGYDGVVNSSALQQIDDQEDVQLDDHVVESPQITLLDGVSRSHNHELQNIESVIANENVAVNNVGLEQGADQTDIFLTEQSPPQDQLIQELSSSFTLTNGSQNDATNEYDDVTNNRGLQQGDGQYGVAQELSSVGLVDDQNEVAQESSSVARVDDQNEVAEESSAVALVDDILVNNPDLQPVDAHEDEPQEEDQVEIWRREVGVVGTHGDGRRFSLAESFMFIKPLKGNRKRGY
ncbi:hypothetical protein CTI12_AA390960 [Artemisia annua]|uniref:Uncharacterized protein n=1 Tax=Artemisia annua TaxID=35608 RepID=A0A2U1MF68_ARTAN|nr:hypothetical protein CTI12_AA390960 [Artemisia annua]